MMTPKQLMLELLKPDGHPDRQLDQYEGIHIPLGDPILRWMRPGLRPGATIVDRWGVTVMFPEGAPGPIPHVTEENKVIKDITRWREYVKAPEIEENCTEGWEEFAAAARAQAGDDKLLAAFMPGGIFEQVHFMMNFEDSLAYLYEYPDEMHELIDYITDYRIRYAKLLIDKIQPDAIFSHDDWGSNDSLFMKPDMWREFFKEPYRRFYGYIRSRGVIAIHHADSYLAPIVDDMVEIGIQAWQGVLPENNIPELQRHLAGKMVLMGGIGAAIDREDTTEEEARTYVRQVLEENCPGGHYIPSITYGLSGTVYPKIDQWIDSEIAIYNSALHVPRPILPPVPRRKAGSGTVESAAASSVESDDVLANIAKAVRRGQKKKVVSFCQQAIDENIPAETVISDGLMRGMNAVGDDFSAGKAFVPEMLVAARCMSAATEMLKPYLTDGNSESLGRVVLGTTKGDLHDIGKNLVRIMLEGSGFDVIDLGVDVTAEQFVDTAIEQKCNIIACSSLLTTSLAEMERVVKLCQERQIRDDIIIMIGGAPVNQNYCERIGADIYTQDAGEAAKAAVAAIRERNAG